MQTNGPGRADGLPREGERGRRDQAAHMAGEGMSQAAASRRMVAAEKPERETLRPAYPTAQQTCDERATAPGDGETEEE